MLSNINQPIVAGLLSLSVAGTVGATALQFNDRIEYKIGNRIESSPAWLVPPKAEFRSIERGYGGIKILLSLLATGGMIATMLIARNEGELEPVRQRIKKYQSQADEFDHAAKSAYQMAGTQMRYKKLSEADERAFEDELESNYCQSLGIDPQQQQALLTGTATLDATNNPSDKVESVESVAIESEAVGPQMPNLSKYPSVLVYGVPGAGKSMFTEQEVTKRLKEGHRIIVLDPHAACGQWQGCEVIGAGMDYEAIDTKLIWFQNQVKSRYKTISSQPNPQFQPLTIVAEEFTNWSKRCSDSGEHFQTVSSDIRKAECYSIIVSHTRNLAGLGDAKGMGALRDESMLEVEILGEYNAKTERATPRYEALVKMPGHALINRKLVKLVKNLTPQSATVDDVPKAQINPSTGIAGSPRNVPHSEPANPGSPDGTRAERLEALLAKVLAEASQPVFSAEFPLSEHSERVQLARLIITQDLGKEKTIWLLWGVRPGGRNHAAYTEARAMLDRLINNQG